MDTRRLLDEHDRDLRRDIRPDGPGSRVERAPGVVRHVGADADGWNGVVWSGLDPAGADAAIAGELHRFAELGRAFEWKLYSHDTPHDLAQRLRAAGFTAEPEETLMAAPVADLPADAAPPEGVVLRPVTTRADAELAADACVAAFGGDREQALARSLRTLEAGPEAGAEVVATAGGEAVCAARIEFHPGTGFAGLWGGGTAPRWRRRGVYRAMVAHRVRLAAERGVRHLLVDASDQSRPILQRLGFAVLATTTPYQSPNRNAGPAAEQADRPRA